MLGNFSSRAFHKPFAWGVSSNDWSVHNDIRWQCKLQFWVFILPGKILLLNVAVFPLFFYLASTFLPLKSVVDKLLAIEFIWLPAHKQMISKQCLYLDKCRGGWDLLHFPLKKERQFIFQKELGQMF